MRDLALLGDQHLADELARAEAAGHRGRPASGVDHQGCQDRLLTPARPHFHRHAIRMAVRPDRAPFDKPCARFNRRSAQRVIEGSAVDHESAPAGAAHEIVDLDVTRAPASANAEARPGDCVVCHEPHQIERFEHAAAGRRNDLQSFDASRAGVD
jgi:hypothetical protein